KAVRLAKEAARLTTLEQLISEEEETSEEEFEDMAEMCKIHHLHLHRGELLVITDKRMTARSQILVFNRSIR
ncbi:hypothetical protein A2U01_0098223, partial [Trifolium medium]|nr:hypothetical protein [Trifolium medium]